MRKMSLIISGTILVQLCARLVSIVSVWTPLRLTESSRSAGFKLFSELKTLKVRENYSAACRTFNSLLVVVKPGLSCLCLIYTPVTTESKHHSRPNPTGVCNSTVQLNFCLFVEALESHLSLRVHAE